MTISPTKPARYLCDFQAGNLMRFGILEGRAAGYSQRFVGAMYRNPGETGIPTADSDLFSRDHSGIF